RRKEGGMVPLRQRSLSGICLGSRAWPALHAGHLAVQEVVDEREDLVSLVLKHEVTSVEKMELEIPQVSLIGMRTSLGENEIVLAPDDECRRLLIAEPGLHFGI